VALRLGVVGALERLVALLELQGRLVGGGGLLDVQIRRSVGGLAGGERERQGEEDSTSHTGRRTLAVLARGFH